MIEKKWKEILVSKNLIGCKVVNPSQQELGSIEDVALDLTNGQIVYAILSFGGFLGLGEKKFAMPWEAFYLDTAQDETVVLDVPKEKLENAPGLEDELPTVAQWEYVDNIYQHYGYAKYTGRRPIGRTHGKTREESLSRNAGLANSGEAKTFDEAGFESNRIKESGIG